MSKIGNRLSLIVVHVSVTADRESLIRDIV